MGTASLVIGIALILIGFGLIANILLSQRLTQEQWNDDFLGILIISTPMIIVGGLFLRRYDHDKKIEKKDDYSLDILKERYAKGEITKEEFEQMRKELEDDDNDSPPGVTYKYD